MRKIKSFEKFSVKFVLGFSLLIGLLLSYWAGRYTFVYQDDYSTELMLELPDSLTVNLLWMAAAVGGFWIVGWLFSKLSEKGQALFLQTFALAEIVILGVILAYLVKTGQNIPLGDQAIVYQSVIEFSADKYTMMEPGNYLDFYPQQYGMIFILDSLFRLFGKIDIIYFQYLNVPFLMLAVYFGWRLTKEIFHNPRTELFYQLLVLFFFPLYLYVYFAYGEVISIGAGTLCLWAALRFCNTLKARYGITAVCAVTLAVFIRKNSLVLLIAVCIILIFQAMLQKRIKLLIPLVLMIVLPQLCNMGVKTYYEQRSGHDIGKGIPAVMWMLMGTQQSEEGYGVYNGNSVLIYNGPAENDPERCAEIGMEELKGQLEDFLGNPSYALDFYRNKLINQWNDPVYSVFIMTRALVETADPMILDAYFGELHDKLEDFLNRYHFIMYFGFGFCAVWLLRQKFEIAECLPFIAIIGGFLFSILWEAKPRYVIPYVFLMLPAAAMGIRSIQLASEAAVRYLMARLNSRGGEPESGQLAG